jgi:carbon-monoxide dehydrogenase small subunit/xanthine dehydrogenase small subunit
MKLKLRINGELRVREVHPMKRLLDVLREDIQLKGAKEGCGEGECGACAVIMDGRLVNSCMVSALRACGSEILTIEGLGCSVAPDALQTAFVEEGAIQCGFCTSGMIIAARALLERQRNPSLDDIKTALSGNLCRCTGYEKIYRAIDRAVKVGYSKEIKPISVSRNGENIPEFSDEEKSKFFSPRNLEEAVDILAKKIPGLKVIAGGTDVFPDVKSNKLALRSAMDISNISELRTINFEKKYIKIGSCVTNTEIMESYLLRKSIPSIVQAASMCGAVAVQNMATIGGNIMTASGAADMITALMALDADVRIIGRGLYENIISHEKFINGYHSTVLKADELVKEILIPTPITKRRFEAFYKRGSRRALTYSRVSLACCLEKNEEGYVCHARFAACSMSPVPHRLRGVENMLIGAKVDEKIADAVAKKAGQSVSPRKESAYRKKVTENLVRKFILSCVE